MVRVAGVLGLRAQPPVASVIVTVVLFVPEPTAVAVQEVKPEVSVTTGLAGTTKAVLNVTVTVSPAPSGPVALGVKPTLQSARAPAVCGVPAKVTFETKP